MSARRLTVEASIAAACAAVFGVATPASAQDGVGFRASLTPDTVYVGQQATYLLAVSLPSEVRQRLRRNPVFIPPEARAMLAYELPMSKGDPTREGSEVHVFRRALFPLTPGRYEIAPSLLTYALPQSPSFFSREEERTLRSQSLALVAVDPPLGGRPSSWLGAVGSWRTNARIDVREGRVGDPFVLTLRVEGIGNATLLPRPPLAIGWADVVAEDERVVLDTTPLALGGSKEFSWLVTPRQSGTLTVPALDYSYFDPGSRRYAVARSSTIGLRVRAGDLVRVERPAASVRSDSLLALRPQLEGARPIALRRGTLWAWLALLAPLPWVVTSRRRRAPVTRPRTPRQRLADATASSPGTLRTLFDAAVRERTGVRLDVATDAGALTAALRREGVTPETAKDAEHLRDALDSAAYARGARAPDLRERVRLVLDRIAAEARRHASLLMVCALSTGLGGILMAQQVDDALVAFSQGQTAYAGRDFERARDAFLVASRAAPRDPATWANLGTAAWQAGDTAGAVLGWQRALRLDPLATDLRSRLSRVRAPQDRGAANVWPVPPLPVATVALLLWWAAWVVLAIAARRGAVGGRWLLLAPSLVLVGLAAIAESRLRADDLLVIATAAPLRALPALGAEAGSVPLVGEVVTVLERRGVWVRISLDAGRQGWYPAERAYPLVRD